MSNQESHQFSATSSQKPNEEVDNSGDVEKMENQCQEQHKESQMTDRKNYQSEPDVDQVEEEKVQAQNHADQFFSNPYQPNEIVPDGLQAAQLASRHVAVNQLVQHAQRRDSNAI